MLHNPHNLSNETIGIEDGYRLLCKDEIIDGPQLHIGMIDLWLTSSLKWDSDTYRGNLIENIYRTKLSKLVLGKARVLIANNSGAFICCGCGEEMAHNVARLGDNGGFIHKDTGRFSCGHIKNDITVTDLCDALERAGKSAENAGDYLSKLALNIESIANQTYQSEIWKVPKDYIYNAIEDLKSGIKYAKNSLEENESSGKTVLIRAVFKKHVENNIISMEKTLNDLQSLNKLNN